MFKSKSMKHKLIMSVMVASATLGLALVTTSANNGVTASASAKNGFVEISQKESDALDKKTWNSMSAEQKKLAVEDAKTDDPVQLKDKNSNLYKYNQVLKKQAAAKKSSAKKAAAKKAAAKKAAAKNKAKSYAYKVSKLTSKKTKSNKYVKVNGKIKVNNKVNAKKHHAKWARITTYKGYKFVRLSKNGNFKATIKAPKAKNTWAKAGYYTKNMKHGKVVKKHGKIVYTFHLLSASKKVSVKAYK
ncbi:hypothetical protein [Levilactobacillus sp. 244-2]|uniref:hypothetical protein n=3 Tax=Lactobacillaceae TaxID=33958 RepID=UPI0019517D9D|nr:hypothetical protein [Levilactobacillus sp. 244-2]